MFLFKWLNDIKKSFLLIYHCLFIRLYVKNHRPATVWLDVKYKAQEIYLEKE